MREGEKPMKVESGKMKENEERKENIVKKL